MKLKSLLTLFFISLIPFSFVMYIWFSIPKGIELGGLVYIFGIPLLFPFALAFVLITYKIISRWLKLEKLPLAVVIALPVVINLISTQWYFVASAVSSVVLKPLYSHQYNAYNPEIKLVEGRLITGKQPVYNFAAEYQYKLVLNNPSKQSFDNVSVWISLSYNSVAGKKLDLGLDILDGVNIKPGQNTLEKTMLIDSFNLRCRYAKAQSPLQLVVTQKILGRDKSISIPLDSALRNQLLEINNNLEKLNVGEPFPLRKCLDN